MRAQGVERKALDAAITSKEWPLARLRAGGRDELLHLVDRDGIGNQLLAKQETGRSRDAKRSRQEIVGQQQSLDRGILLDRGQHCTIDADRGRDVHQYHLYERAFGPQEGCMYLFVFPLAM